MVSIVLDCLADAMTPAQIVEEYPTHHVEDIPAALGYAAELARERFVAFDQPRS